MQLFPTDIMLLKQDNNALLSSVKSQKADITIQKCSVENKKGAVNINIVQR